MAHTLPKFDRAFLSVLVRGGEKVFENAEQLYREGETLAKAGATARALFLHQISLEECSKVDSLGAWAVSLLCGYEVDQKRILAVLARHSSKNKSNAYMLEGSPPEKEAKARGDWETASKEFKMLQEQFHQKSNTAKNASLYVDWNDGEFVAPREQINKEMLAEIIVRNETFLGYAYNNLKMLKRLEKAPDDMQRVVVEFAETAENMRKENPGETMHALNELIRKFVDVRRKEQSG
jgi:AbiV family abortive infection protein